MRALVTEKLKEFHQKYFPEADYQYEIKMPWNRMFEIELAIGQGRNETQAT
ncbi:MAG: hypothetical protein RR466_02940 [Hungatella sp.]